MRLLKLFLVVGLCAICAHTRAQVFETYTFNADFNGVIGQTTLPLPDGNASGVRDMRPITSAISQIGSVTVSLTLSGEFNGDIYGYLRHDSGFSVLLNRVGRSGSASAGYADSGFFNVTLNDAPANNDIHTYQNQVTPSSGSPLTGTWKSDGRNIDPASVLDTTSRTAGLDVFNGLNANGNWTLYLADMQSGGSSTLTSWEMQITAVPEPQETALIVVLGLGLFALWRKRAIT